MYIDRSYVCRKVNEFVISIVYNKAKGIPYKLMFLRRVWTNIHPGQDPIADAIFLYPQVSVFAKI